MTQTRIAESLTGAITGEPDRSGLIPIRIITEGVGSRAEYPREVLAESGVKSFTKGTLMFINHPDPIDQPHKRDLNTVAARLAEDAVFKEVDGEWGLWSYAKPRNAQVAEFLEEYKDKIGVSIYNDSKAHLNTATGRMVVDEFVADDPYKSIDFVVAPGRGGGIETRVFESLRAVEHSLGATEDNDSVHAIESQEEEKQMDELTKLVESLMSRVADLDTKIDAKFETIVKASESAETANAEKVDALATAQEVTVKVAEAKLPEASTARVFESLAAGKTVDEAIRSEGDYYKAIEAVVTARVAEHAQETGQTFNGRDSEDKGLVRF